MKDPVDRTSDRTCFKCAFKGMAYKTTPYCFLKRFPILNPEIGCSRQMTKGEFKSKNCYITAEEIAAAAEAQYEDS